MSDTMALEVMGTIKAEHICSPLGEGWRVAVNDEEQIVTDPQAAKDLLLECLGLPSTPASGSKVPARPRRRRTAKELMAALRELLAKGVPREKAAAQLRVKPARLEKLMAELEAGVGVPAETA